MRHLSELDDNALKRLLRWIDEELDAIKQWHCFAMTKWLDELHQQLQDDATEIEFDTLAAAFVTKLAQRDSTLAEGASDAIALARSDQKGPSAKRQSPASNLNGQVENDCTPYRNKIDALQNVLKEPEQSQQKETSAKTSANETK